MKLLKLLEIADVEYSICKNGESLDHSYALGIEINEIFFDSRKVVPNGLYIAMEGVHSDSHQYIEEASDHGALAAIVSKNAISDGRVDPKKYKIPLIAVDNCRSEFAKLFAAWYDNPQKKLKFIGVTGTNGKTTVCKIIYDILSASGRKCGMIGTMGSICHVGDVTVKPTSPLANMTTPDPPELYKTLDVMYSYGVEYVIMEVTSHSLSLCKVAPINFEIGVFTNLSEDHLDFHKDMEGYFEAKSKLFESCKCAVVNIDDIYGRRLADNSNVCVHTCSCEGRGSSFYATDVHASSQTSIEYKLSSYKMRLRVKMGIAGAVNVMNSMQAAAVCHLLGVSPREIKDVLEGFGGVCGRLERLKFDEKVDFSVYIDYAHTPDALENLLRTVRGFSRNNQRIVLVFGCGGDRDKYKRPIMGRIASQMSDFFILTSDNSRGERVIDIIKDIVSGVDEGASYTIIESRNDAIEYAIKNARRGDVILLAGKGHEEYEIDSKGKRPFSERNIACSLVRKYWTK